MEAASVASRAAQNVLAAAVHVRVRDADSVAVRFHLVEQPAEQGLTPSVPASSDVTEIPVLGLLPGADTRFAPSRSGRAERRSDSPWSSPRPICRPTCRASPR